MAHSRQTDNIVENNGNLTATLRKSKIRARVVIRVKMLKRLFSAFNIE